MHGFGVTILGILNQKYHEEGDDRRSGVYDQLPGVGEMKRRAGEDPNEDDEYSPAKCPGAAERDGRTARENTECVTYNAEEIAFLLVFLWFFDLGFVQCYLSFRA